MKTSALYVGLLGLIGCADAHTSSPSSAADTADSGAAAALPPVAQTATPRAMTPSELGERTVRELRQGMSRSSEGLVLEKRPDGVSQVLLKGRVQSATVVFKDATGKRQQMCIDNPAAVDHVFGVQP